MLLKPLDKLTAGHDLSVPPSRTCENCGKVVPVGHDAINVIITIGSPGHPDLPPFQCPQVEHWACSPDCWAQVAHACIDEHILPTLRYKHSQVNICH